MKREKLDVRVVASDVFAASDELRRDYELLRVSEREESVFAYEQANIPAEAWPPTRWYEAWVRGQDVFDLEPEELPIEFRWFAYRRST